MAFSSEYDDDEVMSEINMTPLVDVMLVLLIIFMLTVPVLTQSVDIELPQTVGEASPVQQDVVSLSVDANGKVFWNDDPITDQQLDARLMQSAAVNPQPQLHIRGERSADYEYVVRVMAAAQQAGLTRLGFVTEVE